ncbi:hypothetical protein KZZ52_57300 [Dactylosporangium sp. AC04546]|uniref:hypothetical protein n=1 Tax=Dactylosporangium sp. AC04546 TaxID=2862460 RepID=UPI001EDD49D2|nr:hypothetical protein [Dactylosporangium sp. AC04546]WVK83368.1 hypothetical protein KZZ52_57300 [Dactylosporangium sp. AC04546]
MADLDVLAERVLTTRGRTIIADLTPDRFDDLASEVDASLDLIAGGGHFDIRFALGTACTTVARTIEHLTAALQLPYQATRGWSDFVSSIGDRAASLNQWLIVYNAADLLRHEDEDRWHELVAALGSEPSHMGGGCSTLVLLDDPWRWEQSRFGNTRKTQAAADQGRQ